MLFKYKGRFLSEIFPFLYIIRTWQKRFFRFIYWQFSTNKYANTFEDELLPYRYVKHSSKLLRMYSNDEREYKWQKNKVKNLKIAAKAIDRIVIKPGEVFSFCKLVGLPTSKKGYLEGMELSRGEARAGIGGGICQLANLITWMTWHTPLTIIERSHHSFDPFPDQGRILPFGSGAAIFWNYVDLQIKNTSKDEVFQIIIDFTETALKGEIRSTKRPIYSYKIIEKEHFFIQKNEHWYRSNEIWRSVFNRGVDCGPKYFVAEERLVKNFARVKYEPDPSEYIIKF